MTYDEVHEEINAHYTKLYGSPLGARQAGVDRHIDWSVASDETPEIYRARLFWQMRRPGETEVVYDHRAKNSSVAFRAGAGCKV